MVRVPGFWLGVFVAFVALASTPAWSARYAVVVGTNDGSPPDAPLSFAEDDADRMAGVLTSLAGFQPYQTTVLQATDAETMRRAIVHANDQLRVTAPSGDDSVLLVYFSGHADDGALRMNGTRFAFDELQQLVRGSPARFRILVIDACRSGAITALKGGQALPPIDVSAVSDLETEGFVVLTSASAGEAAQESRVLGGSFFTHHLISGLLGNADDNADGDVSLAEAYSHAYENTLRDSSVTLAGSQHPTFRYDFRGQGELVLTRLAQARGGRGRLLLPMSADFLVLSGNEEGRVVAEARRGHSRSLWLPPGRYFVRGRLPRTLLEGEVVLRAGESVAVREQDLRTVEYTRLVRKGADEAMSVAQGPSLLVWGRTGLTASTNPCLGAGVGWSVALRYVSLEPRGTWCREESRNATLTSTTDEVTAQLRASYTFDLPLGLGVDVGSAVGGTWFQQTFVTRGTAPPTNVVAGNVAAFVGTGLDLPWGLVLRAEVEARSVIVSLKGVDGTGVLGTPLVGVGALRLTWFF